MNELKENVDIKDLIYEIRGKQVMLDSDLAVLYGCKNGTKEINQAVKNNPLKFPDRYCFRISEIEKNNLKSKVLTSNYTKGGSRKGNTVFTEQGIYMLATILKTKVATEATIKIMDTFVKMRRLINENKDVFRRIIEIENDTSYIKNALIEHDNKIEELFDKFNRKEDLKSKLFFDGEIYDAYSLLVDIIGKAHKEIIIIDNFVDKVTLDILSKKKVNVMVLLITDENKSKLNNTDINKFNSEYPLLRIKYTNAFHDRFIIIDNKELYHLGASLKDLGKKVFGITKIEDQEYLKQIIKKVNEASNMCPIY